MTKNLSVRDILAQLLGGEDLLDKGETGFKLVKFKSAPDLENFKFFSEFTSEDFESVVGYIQSSTRLFVISRFEDKNGEVTYTAENYFKNKAGEWQEEVNYEYTEYFANDIEVWKKNLEILQELFEN